MQTMPTLQQLSPAAARLCLEVERFCLRGLRLPRGARLLLALSGGADSTALTAILHLLSPGLDLTLYATHVNHGLRQEADADAAHALDLCRGLHIPCAVRAADVTGLAARQNLGLEDAGRRLRYALLEEDRLARGADFTVLGHHAQDLSEDVLLRLTRGTGWPALGGMPARDDARRILRPLLAVSPHALKTLLRECGLEWREDASNSDRRFKRNRLRQDVLPLLRAENPSLDKSLQDLWRMARLDEDYWEQVLDAALARHPWITDRDKHSLTLPGELLHGLHSAARLRLYLRAVRQLCRADMPDGKRRPKGQARARTLLALEEALRQGRDNTLFQLPGGIEARLKGGGICFSLNLSIS